MIFIFASKSLALIFFCSWLSGACFDQELRCNLSNTVAGSFPVSRFPLGLSDTSTCDFAEFSIRHASILHLYNRSTDLRTTMDIVGGEIFYSKPGSNIKALQSFSMCSQKALLIRLVPDPTRGGGSKTQVTFHRSLVAGHCFTFWK